MAPGTVSATGLTDPKLDLGTEMVTVYVGLKRKEFVLHKNLICTIDFFEKAFSGNFKESTERSMHLPDDNPGAFSLFVNWLYRCTLPTGHTESYLNDLMDLYIFGEKICNTELKDKTMDSIQDMAFRYKLSEPFIKAEVVNKVFDNVPSYYGLPEFLIFIMVDTYIDKSTVGTFKHCSSANLQKVWEMSKSNFEILKHFHDRSLGLIERPAIAGCVDWDPRERKENHFARCCFYCYNFNTNCCDYTGSSLIQPKYVQDVSSGENGA